MAQSAHKFETINREIKHDQRAKASLCPGCTAAFISFRIYLQEKCSCCNDSAINIQKSTKIDEDEAADLDDLVESFKAAKTKNTDENEVIKHENTSSKADLLSCDAEDVVNK